MEIYGKLQKIQSELKAPKGQRNTYGNYNYRSCEDILTAVKPLLSKHGAVLILTDSIHESGARYYVQATATLYDLKDGSTVTNTAYAREEETKKGMDGSQITGTASSYARKYALNGLFLIDDTKDADTDEYRRSMDNAKEEPKAEAYPTRQDMLKFIVPKYPEGKLRDTLFTAMRVKSFDELPDGAVMAIYNKCIQAQKKANAK